MAATKKGWGPYGLKELASLGVSKEQWSRSGTGAERTYSPSTSGRREVRQTSSHRMRGYGGISDLQGGSAVSWSNRRKACSKESWRTLRIQLTSFLRPSGRVWGVCRGDYIRSDLGIYRPLWEWAPRWQRITWEAWKSVAMGVNTNKGVMPCALWLLRTVAFHHFWQTYIKKYLM